VCSPATLELIGEALELRLLDLISFPSPSRRSHHSTTVSVFASFVITTVELLA
jgi:hypothetical protein